MGQRVRDRLYRPLVAPLVTEEDIERDFAGAHEVLRWQPSILLLSNSIRGLGLGKDPRTIQYFEIRTIKKH
jgi:hypothetical protein